MTKFKKHLKTDFLLPRDNFCVGMGSVLNISGYYFSYRYSKSGKEADNLALLSDWQNVGKDIFRSQGQFIVENNQHFQLNGELPIFNKCQRAKTRTRRNSKNKMSL